MSKRIDWKSPPDKMPREELRRRILANDVRVQAGLDRLWAENVDLHDSAPAAEWRMFMDMLSSGRPLRGNLRVLADHFALLYMTELTVRSARRRPPFTEEVGG